MGICYMAFYPDDWLAGVGHLDYAERGAYLHLLCCMWKEGQRTGEPTLPDDDATVARLLGVSPRQWRRWRAALVDGPMAVLTAREGRLEQKRLLREWEKASRLFEKASANGRKGAQRRWNANAVAPEPHPDDGNPNGEAMATRARPRTQNAEPISQTEGGMETQRVVCPPAPSETPSETRCPAGFAPSDETLQWAARECPSVDVAAERAAFVQWDRHPPGVTDWDARFRCWLLRQRAWQQSRGGVAPSPPQKRETLGVAYAVVGALPPPPDANARARLRAELARVAPEIRKRLRGTDRMGA